MKASSYIQLMAMVLTAGCSSTGSIPIYGTTLAQGRLKQDIFRVLPSYAKVVTGCTEPITGIRVEMAEVPDTIESNKSGALTQGQFKERWYLTLCGKEEPILVTFTPDGKGGTSISLKRDK